MYPVKSASHQERHRHARRENKKRKKGIGREEERKGKTFWGTNGGRREVIQKKDGVTQTLKAHTHRYT